MYYCYILFSNITNKYYVGSTGDELIERLRRHNSNHDGFTGKANDWKIVHSETFNNKQDALKREHDIKNKKIRIYIERLILKA